MIGEERAVGCVMVGLGLMLVALIVAGIASLGLSYFPQRTETCTVTEKYVAREGDGNTYRVITEECGTLKIGGFLTGGRFNTADTYADLEVGTTYEMGLRGTRFGLLSTFPAIGEYEEVAA